MPETRDTRLFQYKMTTNLCNKFRNCEVGSKLSFYEKFKFAELQDPVPVTREAPVELVLAQKDVIDMAARDATADLNPLIINPTRRDLACGGWDNGDEGFEESLAYRSTLSMSLNDDLYPLAKGEGVYSPVVYIFRGAFMQSIKSFQVGVVSLVPQVRADFSVENDRRYMITTLRSAFQIAVKNGHRSVILNTFGCNSDNNPSEIAELLGVVISEYSRAIARVTVVFDFMPNSPNLIAFKKYLKIQVLPEPEDNNANNANNLPD